MCWLRLLFPGFCFSNRLSIPDLQEAFPALLGVLKEAVQLNLAPPGYFLLLRYGVSTFTQIHQFLYK